MTSITPHGPINNSLKPALLFPPISSTAISATRIEAFSPEPSLTDPQQKWPPISHSLHQWLEPLQETDLATELSCIKPNGEEFRLSRSMIIVHMVNHSTLHRGQVMSMLRAFGVKPPNTDQFSLYLLQ